MKLSAVLLPLMFAPALIFTSGCGSSQLVAEQQSQLDSLMIVNASLLDSLQLFESIDSGSYYRVLRLRDSRINELEYMLSVCRDGGLLFATEQVDDLFHPASSNLLGSGLARLDSVASRVKELPDSIVLRIEAHADNIPPGPSIAELYPTNWELSAARATAIARYLIDTHAIAPSRLEVVSLGDARPIYTNTTSSGRQRNRRIEFSVIGSG